MFANPVFITPGILRRMKEIQENSILVRVRVHQWSTEEPFIFYQVRGGVVGSVGGGG